MFDPDSNFHNNGKGNNFDYDLLPTLAEERLIKHVKNEGYIEFESFDAIEEGYQIILLHNDDVRKHVFGKLIANNQKENFIEIERHRNIIQKLFTKKHTRIKRVEEGNYRIYACSGDFNNFDTIFENFQQEG